MMHDKNVMIRGVELGKSSKVLVMLHGRGSTSEDISSLARHLNVKDYTILAPQATGHTWYPYSFLAPPEANEPWLSSAIELLSDIVNDITDSGVEVNNIYFLGFSQGACLTLEFVTRYATRYGGVVAFTGGLIGDKIYTENYTGDFQATPILIGTSDPDPHVPVERVYESSRVLRSMNAVVSENVYNNMGHTINQDEIDTANKIIFGFG
jgi:phospholipase/carboxylesterase